MLTHQWPKISLDFICIFEKIAVAGAPPWTPMGKLMTLSRYPSRTPDGLWCSHPTIPARPVLQCPNYGHLNLK